MSGRRTHIRYRRPVRGIVALALSAAIVANLAGCYGHKYDPERFIVDTLEVAGQVLVITAVYTLYFFAGCGAPRMVVVAVPADAEGPGTSGDEGPVETPSEGEPVVAPSP